MTTFFVPPTLPTRLAQLTPRQADILHGLCRGLSNAEIGARLHISEDSVKTTAKHLFIRLGARNRTHAVALAYSAGRIQVRMRQSDEFGRWLAS